MSWRKRRPGTDGLRPGRSNTCPFDGARLKAGRDKSDGSRRGKKVWQCPRCRAVF